MRIAHNGFARIEQWLEVEREQLALWVPVALGAGIAGWFVLPGPAHWLACCCGALGLACLALLLPVGARLRHMLVAAGLLGCIGCLLVWGKATWLGQPPLARPIFAQVTGTVTAVAKLPAQQMVRVGLRPIAAPALPAAIRVNIVEADVPDGLGKGAVLRFRVRLMPPAPPSVPGAFDFARRAYFQGIGATGRALAPVEMVEQRARGRRCGRGCSIISADRWQAHRRGLRWRWRPATRARLPRRMRRRCGAVALPIFSRSAACM